MNGEGSVDKKRGHRGAPKGHRGGSVEEAHTLICHVLVCESQLSNHPWKPRRQCSSLLLPELV